MPLTFSVADAGDAAAIAALHAASWRATYRGVLPDDFLDLAAEADRLQQWTERMARPRSDQVVIKAVAEDGGLCGFACVFLEGDAEWGALLDNLHVAPCRTGDGIGQQLFDAVFARVRAAQRGTSLYLWVVASNVGARRFYARNGGRDAERAELEIRPGLRVPCVRVVWE